VHAQHLNVVAGRNLVATDGTLTPLADDPSQAKPSISLDSSALEFGGHIT